MRLSLHTDYAFRTLMYLAVNDKHLSTIDEIAKTYNISRNHLVKVVNTLVKAGFIDTVRGKGGGLKLAHQPNQINVGAVVRITEPDFAIVECFLSQKNSCIITPICELKHIFKKAVNNFLAELDCYNLNDLIKNKKKTLSSFRSFHNAINLQS